MLATMVKTGRTLLLHTTLRNQEDHDNTPGYYAIGDMRYFDVALPLNFVLATLKASGFIIVEANEIPEKERTVICNNKASHLKSVAFIIGIKI